MRRAVLLLLLALAGSSSVHTQTAAPPTRPFVETLASEKLGGREAGSADERAAGDYIAAQLARAGARPLPGRSDMFQSFAFTAGSRDAGSRVSVTSGSAAPRAFTAASDVQWPRHAGGQRRPYRGPHAGPPRETPHSAPPPFSSK